MDDVPGMNVSQYHLIYGTDDKVFVALQAIFAPETELPEYDADVLQKNPQMITRVMRDQKGSAEKEHHHTRVFYPAVETYSLQPPEQQLNFDPWLSWEKAAKFKVLLRESDVRTLLARASEKEAFMFPSSRVRHRYLPLAFIGNTGRFEPLFFRAGDCPILRLDAEMSREMPVIRISRPTLDTVPAHLLTDREKRQQRR